MAPAARREHKQMAEGGSAGCGPAQRGNSGAGMLGRVVTLFALFLPTLFSSQNCSFSLKQAHMLPLDSPGTHAPVKT
jgi:hypothetical protein